MKPKPRIVIFDVDGVLVDVQDSYHRTIIETVRHFTGRRVSRSGIHWWKNRSGYNDDWKLTVDWIRSLGGHVRYAEVARKFQQLYQGKHFKGYIARERWLLGPRWLGRLARRTDLAVFTGRPRREVLHTLCKFGVRPYFRQIVALEDVRRSKPHPEGLLRILKGHDPCSAVYIGDNVDDALAARRAGVPFIGVLPRRSAARWMRLAQLQKLGALAVLGSVNELERWLQ